MIDYELYEYTGELQTTDFGGHYNLTVYRCRVCSALVAGSDTTEHTEWHWRQ